MPTLKTIFILLLCFAALSAGAQQTVYGNRATVFTDVQFLNTDSGWVILHFNSAVCKAMNISPELIKEDEPVSTTPVKKEKKGPKVLEVHGNVSYDYFYRSKVDTPFQQNDLQQHMERVWLNVTVKEKYPFRISFTARQSNTPFLRDLSNINLGFDKYNYLKLKKQQMADLLLEQKMNLPRLLLNDSLLKLKKYELHSLKKEISSPELFQKLVEAKERIYFRKQSKASSRIPGSLPAADSLFAMDDISARYKKFKLPELDKYEDKKDSLTASLADSATLASIDKMNQKAQQITAEIARLQKASDSLHNFVNSEINKGRRDIYNAKDIAALAKAGQANGIDQPKQSGLDKFLGNVKSFSVGRSLVDYTELTAQNVMLTGFNLEYNPSWYGALAAGRIDYGFRDVFGRRYKEKGQNLFLGRLGWGTNKKAALILTAFGGRKNNYNGMLAGDSLNSVSNIFGYSVEAIFKKDDRNFISAEVAKSTKTSSNIGTSPEHKPDNLFKYSDDSNLGINVKAQAVIEKTNTKLQGFFRKSGEAFQSFSLFTYNTDQQSWMVKAEQPFLKNRITIGASLRQNDFSNPLTEKTYKTSTVFKSLQATIRFKGWPVVSAGYFPGTQYYVVDKNTVLENVYYILNGSAIHTYNAAGIQMTSSIIYNRYFNKATDSGFVLYKGVNYIMSQSLIFKKLQLNGGYAFNTQTELSFYTLDANGDYSLGKKVKVGGGVKYNHVRNGPEYWGKSARLGIDVSKLGVFQFSYEKSFLPTIQQTLYAVEIGRVSWFKSF
ncbi:hypothetical protein [Ferruginibacter sp. HRS2-29]|uniref:hypothetical protein n=1 Tax=Ferruginibacter sp. HRS2-29 TaxID=2487334 RepID=UPI0020CD1F53|nr:hypothetical protein [Ferruginibacter sp. HRS2-29]MCP9752378.1 hypothetical protein [Ferruginibacter sp. HRS2-29]